MAGPICSALGSVALLAMVSSVSAAATSSSTRGGRAAAATTTKGMISYARQAEFLRAMKVATQSDADAQGEIAKLRRLRRVESCLLYTSPSPRDLSTSRMPSSA